jgi:uncharacterized protein DUF899
MSTQTITLRKVDVLSDDDINSPKDWLIARQRLFNRAQELRQLRDQLIVEGRALNCAKADEELVFDAPAGTVMQAELLNRRDRSFLKCSGYHLLGLVGIPLIVAMCLLLQLHKLPNSSLSYSLLNAIVSLLFNFSSSALLKASSFLVSLVGLSRWVTSSAR